MYEKIRLMPIIKLVGAVLIRIKGVGLVLNVQNNKNRGKRLETGCIVEHKKKLYKVKSAHYSRLAVGFDSNVNLVVSEYKEEKKETKRKSIIPFVSFLLYGVE